MASQILVKIRTKVRRLTQRPSEHHLSTTHLDQYIDDSLSDLHRDIRLLEMETYFRFYTIPGQSYYHLQCLPVCRQNFRSNALNSYDAFGPPVSIDGCCGNWIQHLDDYKHICMSSRKLEKTIQPNQSLASYEVNFEQAVNPYSLCIYYRDASRNDIFITDIPACKNKGNLCDENLPNNQIEGSIDYTTGAVRVTFLQSIDVSQTILFRVEASRLGQPETVFKYGPALFLYPTPNKVYQIQMQAMYRPILLLASGEFDWIYEEYWQYLAFCAAKKLFEDTDDQAGIQNVIGPWKEQHLYIQRRKHNQRQMQKYTLRELFPAYRSGGWCSCLSNGATNGCCK